MRRTPVAIVRIQTVYGEERMKESEKSRYILSPGFCLRGWKLLPYAVQHMYAPRTVFFREDEWKLLTACDGRTQIDRKKLSDREQALYEIWEKEGLIRPAGQGDRLLDAQKYRFYPARFKENVHWSVTGRCNYRCRHCFMSAPQGAQGEPSWDQLMTMLDAFARCGIRSVGLTGGEPMYRRDFWDLMDAVRDRGMTVSMLYSNGLLITDKFLDELEKREMWTSFQFSFDGVGHHDWMRGVSGAEKAVLDALKRCRERGIPTNVSMVVCRESVGSIRESVNLMASLGVKSMKVGNASPQGDWKNQSEHYLTRSELWEAFLEYIPHFFEDGMPLTLGLEGFFLYDKDRGKTAAIFEKDIPEEKFGKALMCGHVRREMYVSPKGNVLPCMSMVGGPIEEKFPNMLETPLEEILDSDSLYMDIVNFRIRDFMENNPECKICEYRTGCCGGCRAVAVRDSPDDYLAKDPDACAFFKDGWKARKDALLADIGRL